MNFISQNTHFIDHLNKQPKPAAKLHMINTQMPNNDNHHPSTEVNNMLHTTYHHHITTCSDQCRIMDLPFLEFQGVAAGVVWCGVVWCGVVWCGVVWCGVVWCGVVWCGVVWCGVVWCGVGVHRFPTIHIN